jgi:hypothetical protein
MSSIITPQIASIQTKRVTTGSVTAGLTALVTVTWTAAFADTNYTVSASVIDSTAAGLALAILHVETIAADSVAIRVLNTSVGALTGTIHCIGIHD